MGGCCLIGEIGYTFIPLLKNILNSLRGVPYHRTVPFSTESYYDIQKSPAFELTFIFHVYSCVLSATLNVSFFQMFEY